METQAKQVFIRNEQGKVWGPMPAKTAGMLMTTGQVPGRVEVSEDGVNFGDAAHFPEVQQAIAAPRPAAPAPAQSPPAAPAPARTPASPPKQGKHVARGAMPMAGPGAIAAAKVPAGSARSMSGSMGEAFAAAEVAPTTPATSRVTPPASGPAANVVDTSGLPPSGDLLDVPITRLYYQAASRDVTGMFTFSLGAHAIELFFRKGNPEYVGSTDPADDVGEFLVSQGLCSPSQVAVARSSKDRFGGEIVGALLATGALNPSNGFPILGQRAQQLMLKVLLAEDGTFTFEARELPSHRLMPLGNRWAALLETSRRLPAGEVRRKMQPYLDLPIMKSGGSVSLQDLRLTPQETRALGFIDGVRSLNLLAHDLKQDADHFFRLAFLLKDMEMVSFASSPLAAPQSTPQAPSAVVQPEQEPEPEPEPAPAPAAPATPKAAPRPPKAVAPAPRAPPAAPATPKAAPVAPAAPAAAAAPIDLAGLRAQLQKLKTSNYFELLGLSDKADAPAIKAAYFKLAKVYHPDTIPPGAPPEMGQLKSALFTAIGEAYRTLSDEGTRATYVEELKLGATAGQQYDVAQLFKAEDLFQKACLLVKARKYPDAITMLDEALKLNPDEGEFYAWRGYARFHAAPDRKVAYNDACKEVQQAITRNPRCAAAYYFLGGMAKSMGDGTTAQKHFKKTVELAPDHVDAQREIRLVAKK